MDVPSPNPPQPVVPEPPQASRNPRLIYLLAIVVGIVLALGVSLGGAIWGKIAGLFSPPISPPKKAHAVTARLSDGDLDRQKPQKQAEILLTRAVSRNDGAADLIQAHVENWRGKIQWNSQLSDLTTVALNSSDESVRASAIEVQLAAYGLVKNQSTVDGLLRQADASDHAQKTWALWSLGLLANRGVETARVVQILTTHLQNRKNDEDARRWAVEGLALVGTTTTIPPLLHALHDDPSPIVRERAACSLAQSGMLSHEQRMAAVPQLINYSGDPALDEQTRGWAFQALADISGQRLPNDSAAWRAWYREVVSGQ
jgi:hypothetical protein